MAIGILDDTMYMMKMVKYTPKSAQRHTAALHAGLMTMADKTISVYAFPKSPPGTRTSLSGLWVCSGPGGTAVSHSLGMYLWTKKI